jgi:hypothetical protein
MKKTFPRLCIDCRYSAPTDMGDYFLRCKHPVVNSKDSWALAGGPSRSPGTDAQGERARNYWFAPCGMKGKLWEPWQ